MLVASGVMKLMGPPEVVQGFEQLGWPAGIAKPLGLLEIAIVLIYFFPKTAVLGAILVTGYLGGAIATHVRLGEPFVIPLLIGMAVWGGLYFRDSRVRALLPFRS